MSPRSVITRSMDGRRAWEPISMSAPARLEAGIQTDADELLERYAGVNAGVSVPAGDRVRYFHFEAFHQQWNNTTIEALAARPDIPGIYRERFNMDPESPSSSRMV